jgi:hypothetical protein
MAVIGRFFRIHPAEGVPQEGCGRPRWRSPRRLRAGQDKYAVFRKDFRARNKITIICSKKVTSSGPTIKKNLDSVPPVLVYWLRSILGRVVGPGWTTRQAPVRISPRPSARGSVARKALTAIRKHGKLSAFVALLRVQPEGCTSKKFHERPKRRLLYRERSLRMMQ